MTLRACVAIAITWITVGVFGIAAVPAHAAEGEKESKEEGGKREAPTIDVTTGKAPERSDRGAERAEVRRSESRSVEDEH